MAKGNISVDSENMFPIIKKWLYSDKDIFLRELVSNGCDAVTKLKKLAGIGEAQIEDDPHFKVTVSIFKNAKKLLETVQKAPRDRLLLETDCPYMTPEPCRGRRNDPSLARLTLARLAALRGEDEAALAAALYENGLRLFGIAAG